MSHPLVSILPLLKCFLCYRSTPLNTQCCCCVCVFFVSWVLCVCSALVGEADCVRVQELRHTSASCCRMLAQAFFFSPHFVCFFVIQIILRACETASVKCVGIVSDSGLGLVDDWTFHPLPGLHRVHCSRLWWNPTQKHLLHGGAAHDNHQQQRRSQEDAEGLYLLMASVKLTNKYF